MRLAHLSDTHGRFPPLPRDVDLYVHSGDIHPNSFAQGHDREGHWQRNRAMRQHRTAEEWLGGKTMLLCPGNHDFAIPPWPGIRVLGPEPLEIDGVAFVGFPYIPFMGGFWNYEADTSKMAMLLAELPWGKFDVLVAHCPPHGCLDQNAQGENIGNSVLSSRLAYDPPARLHTILSGHVHESHGLRNMFGFIVSNAATVVRVMDL